MKPIKTTIIEANDLISMKEKLTELTEVLIQTAYAMQTFRSGKKIWWENIGKKYKLTKEKDHIFNHKTRVITEIEENQP